MTTQPEVCYILPRKLGGVVSIVTNLLQHRRPDGFRHRAILTLNRLDRDTPFEGSLHADGQERFAYTLPIENLHRVLDRLAQLLPAGPGVLVSNDWLELALASVRDTGRAVVQILHGDHAYYYDLAVKHEPVIDAYIAYSRAMFDELCRLLPGRRESIFHLPYGIPLPGRTRQATAGPLRLLFAGRLENGQKGVFDLPLIDGRLRESGVAVTWSIVGDGPHGSELRSRWGEPAHVRWLGTRPNAEVIALCAEHDVFVLPTRAEGFPVALLEAMSVGLVPVVSDLATGVPEVVESGVSGFRPAVADVEGFALAIGELGRDRDRLEEMSRAARQVVVERFDIRERVADYQALYARWQALRRPRPQRVPLHYGSRLDQPWLPNAVVYPLRAAARWAKGLSR